MADFKQALDWLNEEKEVRRKDWSLDQYISYVKKLNEIIDVNGDKYESSNESILACDWELYEEKPKHFCRNESYSCEEVNGRLLIYEIFNHKKQLNLPAKKCPFCGKQAGE